jgi:Major Facilitator Superfamily
VVTAMVLPVVFYAQAVCGLSPTRSALLLAPMAIATGVLAPVVGRIVDRSHPRTVIGCGFSTLAIALTWLSIEMTPTTPIWRLVLPLAAMGVGMAFIWAPLGATATRNLPAQLAGAGSGVYNATRQVGSVLGSAGMAAFLTSRLSAELPAALVGAPRSSEGSVRDLPDFLHEPFSAAMSQSMLLPAFVALFGVVAALFLPGFGGGRSSTAALPGTPGASRPVGTRDRGLDDPTGDRTDVFPVIGDFTEDDDPAYRRREYASAGARGRYGSAGYRSSGYHASGYDEGYDERYVDDEDDYVEYTVSFQERALGPPESDEPDVEPVDESDTTPLAARVGHPLHAPAETWHSEPVESWRSLLEESRPNPAPDPIGFAHNGFHVDDGQPLRPLGRPVPPAREGLPRRAGVNGSDALDADFTAIWEAANSANGSSSRHQMPEPEPHARHHRAEAEDPATYGRHSMPHRD